MWCVCVCVYICKTKWHWSWLFFDFLLPIIILLLLHVHLSLCHCHKNLLNFVHFTKSLTSEGGGGAIFVLVQLRTFSLSLPHPIKQWFSSFERLQPGTFLSYKTRARWLRNATIKCPSVVYSLCLAFCTFTGHKCAFHDSRDRKTREKSEIGVSKVTLF
jgi:hypothetical protein